MSEFSEIDNHKDVINIAVREVDGSHKFEMLCSVHKKAKFNSFKQKLKLEGFAEAGNIEVHEVNDEEQTLRLTVNSKQMDVLKLMVEIFPILQNNNRLLTAIHREIGFGNDIEIDPYAMPKSPPEPLGSQDRQKGGPAD